MPRKPTKTTKKVTRKAAPAVAAAPATHECQCGSACQCGCHHGKFKRFIVIVIVFLLGFALAKFVCNPMRQHRAHRKMMEMHPIFTNGCLDMNSIKCPKMVEALQNADVNADGCINLEEFKATKDAMHREMRKMHKMPKPHDMPEMPEPAENM